MADAPAPSALPTVLLTGFLGSGKTTLLRRALTSPDFADTAVVVNEIGEIAIDHYLVDLVAGEVVELPGGCLCCAVREDLAQTLRGLIERRDSGAVRPFRRIAIETTGLADPAPILYTLGADPMLDARLAPARVVTIVAATDGAATLTRFAEAARQAAVADAIVVSKTDLAPLSPELEARLAALNADAERLVGREADDPGAILFCRPRASGNPGGGDDAIAPDSRRHGKDEAGNVAIHSHGIDSFAIALGGPVGRLDFAKALGGLARERGGDLLRVKGLVAFADRPGRPALIQAAQHAMSAPEWLDDWPDADRRSRLVFVVHGIPRADILAQFAFAAPALLVRAPALHA